MDPRLERLRRVAQNPPPDWIEIQHGFWNEELRGPGGGEQEWLTVEAYDLRTRPESPGALWPKKKRDRVGVMHINIGDLPSDRPRAWTWGRPAVPIARIRFVKVNDRYHRLGIGTALYQRAAEVVAAEPEGYHLASDAFWNLSDYSRPFWQKQARKGRARIVSKATRPGKRELRYGLDPAVPKTLENPHDDERLQRLRAAWKAGDVSVKDALMRALARRGELWATAIGCDHQKCGIRVHDALVVPKYSGRKESFLEIGVSKGWPGRLEGRGDVKAMGPRSWLRQNLERLRYELGARSRLLELREEWEADPEAMRRRVAEFRAECQAAGRPAYRWADYRPADDWLAYARKHMREGRESRIPGWNPPGPDERLRELERRAATGEPEAVDQLYRIEVSRGVVFNFAPQAEAVLRNEVEGIEAFNDLIEQAESTGGPTMSDWRLDGGRFLWVQVHGEGSDTEFYAETFETIGGVREGVRDACTNDWWSSWLVVDLLFVTRREDGTWVAAPWAELDVTFRAEVRRGSGETIQ